MTSIEELHSRGLVARRTAELGVNGLDRRTSGRGIGSVKSGEVSVAVVVGIGGTGIQVASRLAAAVESVRSDQHGLNSIQFLGIDAVSSNNQSTALPPGVRLPPGDYLNIGNFDAYGFLEHQRGVDRELAEWWDPNYSVPELVLDDGLKRERMLGRLCFYQHRSIIKQNLLQRIERALALSPEHLARGQVPGQANTIDVYVINSCAGGTGSSGFLEVVAAAHAAARDRGLRARVRPIIFLPGAFVGAIGGGMLAENALQAQRANSYAFFKELDHFLTHGHQLGDALSWPQLDISPTGLVHQVFLLDAIIDRVGIVSDVRDTYEIAAEALYQFLLTESGQRLMGVEAVNVEQALGMLDRFKKPRRYCGLGVSRVVFPGDTYRNHLTMFWCNLVLRSAILRDDPAADGTEHRQRVGTLQKQITGLVQQSGSAEPGRLQIGAEQRGNQAPADLKERPESEYAREIIEALRRMLPDASSELTEVLSRRRLPLFSDAAELIQKTAFSKGDSVPEARRVLIELSRKLNTDLETVGGTLGQARTRLSTVDREMSERLRSLEGAEGQNVFEAFVGRVGGLFGGSGVVASDAAEQLGNSIRDWTSASLSLAVDEARHRFLSDLHEFVKQLINELTRAHERLLTIADKAEAAFKRDELLGKDAGPRSTTTLIPSDSQPEIEISQLSRLLAQTISTEHSDKLGRDEMASFIDRWRSESRTRGFFDLGSENGAMERLAEEALLALLERDAEKYAVADRLPRDLAQAASMSGGANVLTDAINGLAETSQSACWRWMPGRFQPDDLDGGPAEPAPAVSVVVSRAPELADWVDDRFARCAATTDTERIIALTCQWALPLHCLPVLSDWKEDYDRLAARRESQRNTAGFASIEPPSHVSRKFERLPEPLPEYYLMDSTAERLLKALLVGRLIDDSNLTAEVDKAFVRDANADRIAPIRWVRKERSWFGRRFTIHNERISPHDDHSDIPLGGTWPELFSSLGGQQQLQENIESVWHAFADHFSDAVVLSALSAFTEVWLAEERVNADKVTMKVLGLLQNAAEALRVEYGR